jgi:nucleoside-diphosphate-sugar epimerase
MVGNNVVRLLLERGESVRVVDSFITGKRENIAHLASNKNYKFIEADVIDRRHIIQNIPRPAANIQHTLSVSKLQEIIETDLPQAICAQHALPADIDRWRAQEIMEMGKCH